MVKILLKGEKMQDTFLPMSVEEDRVYVYEPYGSLVSKDLECQELSGSAKYICLCMKNIQNKQEFLKKLVASVKEKQAEMIQSAIKRKAICAL